MRYIWADPDLGMHYVRARWMDPQTGSWLSVDSHLDEFAYQYANNMPTTGTDPSGKDTLSDVAAASIVLKGQQGKDPHSLSTEQIALLLEQDSSSNPLGLIHLSDNERAFLGRLLMNQVASAQPGVKAKNPPGEVHSQAQPPHLTNDKQRPGQKPGGPAGSARLSPEADRARLNAELADALGSYGLPAVMHNGRLHAAPGVLAVGTSLSIAQAEATRQASRGALVTHATSEMLRQSYLEALRGGPQYSTAHERAQIARARATYDAVRPVSTVIVICGHGTINIQ